MPPPTLDEFWTLLARTGLVDRGAVETLRREHAANPGGCGGQDPKGVAAWLAGRGLVTRWQAKRLAIGNAGPFFLGDYRLLERHDREGDALLFTARHDPSGRVVSIVLLNTKQCRRIDLWTEIVQRTTAASRAADPMLSRTWSLEQHEASRLIVCEQISGVSLADELVDHGPLPALQAGVLVSQVARAVAELHGLGSVHGNLSLDVLRREPPPGGVPRTGRVRLLQFPLAGDPHRLPLRPWQDDAGLAALGRAASYVAPELTLPTAVCDPRSDVYSIGAILYALLSGSPPCWSGDAKETLRQAALGDGPRPLGPPEVTEEMATLVGYLMARDPAERYQTAAEAADAIAVCLGLGGAAAAASPPPAAERQPEAVPSLVDLTVEPRTGGKGRSAAGGPPATIRRRAARLRLIGGAVTLGIMAVAAAAIVSRLDLGRRDLPDPPVVTSTPQRSPPPETPEPAAEAIGWGEAPPSSRGERPPAENPPPAGRQVIVDDPALPWASPTEGPRPRLAYLPPGSQLILLARPEALLGTEEGGLVIRALGPQVAAGLQTLAGWCGCEAADIESVQAGWQAGVGGEVLAGYAVRLREGRTAPGDETVRRTAWGDTEAIEVEGEQIFRGGGGFSFWMPAAERGRTLVVVSNAPVSTGLAGGDAPSGPTDSLIAGVVRQAAALAAGDGDALQAELPRELEELVKLLDADRHLTLLGSPHYLLTQGRVVLAGPLAKLAEPIEGLFGDAVKAAALSAHFTDSCYLELDAIATLDLPAKQMAAELAGRVEGLADAVELYCAALNPNPYGRVLVLRLPSMLRTMVAHLRSGADGKGVVLNAYLPRHARHNLALATELALAQTPGAVSGGPAATAAPVATDALGRLEQKITLVFAKDTLEKSIQMISEETGVPMDIIGPDLQLEGITKNQSFGLDARDKPAREILLEIMAKANPDGKLVYIVGREEGQETILVTTRGAVAKRGDKLPPGLEAVPAGMKKP